MLRRFVIFWLASAALFGQPQRIISTAPSITEMLYAIGLGDRVVGVTRLDKYPPEAQLKPKIGDFINPNLEAIASLRPDLVIILTNPVRLAERLQALRLKTLELDQHNLGALYESIRLTGDATGAQTRATQLVTSIQSQLNDIRKGAAKYPRRRTMFVIARTTGTLDGIMVAGGSSFVDEIMAAAGGDNVFHDSSAAYPQVSVEGIIARNPEVIIDLGEMSGDAVSEQYKRSIIALWSRLPSLAAVRQHQVFASGSDVYLVPGPRVAEAARAIFKMLHPGVSP
jgi:ABC-type Fe3+-hydroxamate transport system substrate-binding protein